jgi:hypothetical protein
MFFKTASAPILGIYQSSGKFSKCAQKLTDISNEEDQAIKRALNLISKDTIKAIAKVYNLSPNIDDYIFPVPRAVAADVPNSNGDNFSHNELTRFSPNHRCLVYQTFRNDPLHIEHASEDPKAARGFLPDAHYMQVDADDKYVLTVVAADTTKDPPLAEGIMDNTINKFSMGCICDAVQCSYSKCGQIAKSDRELCDHLLWHKMAHIDGELIFENCLGVEFGELSVVGEPAYERAETQYMLQVAASRSARAEVKDQFNVLSSLVSPEDQVEIARYVKENVGRLPESMLRLANRIL